MSSDTSSSVVAGDSRDVSKSSSTAAAVASSSSSTLPASSSSMPSASLGKSLAGASVSAAGAGTAPAATLEDELLLQDFHNALADRVTAVPIAACCALHGVVMRTKAATVLELQKELTAAATKLKDAVPDITVVTGSDVYLRLVSKIVMKMETPEFEPCLRALRERGRHFKTASEQSRANIARFGDRFIQEDSAVLVHGYSRSVMAMLLRASKQKHFDVYVLEGRPGGDGFRFMKELAAVGVPVTLAPDAAIGYIMEKVDLVLVGAHGVVESGGIINKLGTSTVAVVAAAMNKPFYVAVESHKFVRIFPISQVDLQAMTAAAPAVDASAHSDCLFPNKYLEAVPEGSKIEMPQWDYTSPDYITLLVTDIGVFTPSAVSDELIKLYQ